jgi:hypothetical protein
MYEKKYLKYSMQRDISYQDKYLKYKKKYLDLQLDVNNSFKFFGGNNNEKLSIFDKILNIFRNNKENKKIMFIMFPGDRNVKEDWHKDIIIYKNEEKIKKKNDFIEQLEKLGNIYYYEPIYYNISYYLYINKDKNRYGKNIDFTKEDFNIDKVCEKIYEEVKNFDGKFILLGHSIGVYFMYHFSQKYYDRCLFGVNIEGMAITTPPNNMKNEEYEKHINEYIKYTDDDIKALQKILYNGKGWDDKESREAYNNLKYIYLANIAKYKDEILKIEKFKIPIIAFYNYYTDCSYENYQKVNESRMGDIKHIRKNNDDQEYKVVIFLNQDHYLHYQEESKNSIIDNIKYMIQKYNI